MTEAARSDVQALPVLQPNQLPRKRKVSAKGVEAQRLIKQYSAIAGGIGFIPVPIVTQIAIAGLLTKLLNDMCRLYGVSFSDHQVKILVGAVLGGAHADGISYYLLKYVQGYAPALTSPGTLVLRPAIAGLVVYYVGRMFLGHFESGAWVRVKEEGLKQFSRIEGL